MITQLAVYGSFVSNLRVAYNKREPEPFSHITRHFEVIYFSDWPR
ncbi:ATPase [Klebsiella variicola]|nr:ATPase [Klebsiella variicola]